MKNITFIAAFFYFENKLLSRRQSCQVIRLFPSRMTLRSPSAIKPYQITSFAHYYVEQRARKCHFVAVVHLTAQLVCLLLHSTPSTTAGVNGELGWDSFLFVLGTAFDVFSTAAQHRIREREWDLTDEPDHVRRRVFIFFELRVRRLLPTSGTLERNLISSASNQKLLFSYKLDHFRFSHQ